MIDFTRKTWKFFSGRILYEYFGMSHGVIFIRWIYCVMLQSGIYICLIQLYLKINFFTTTTPYNTNWASPLLAVTIITSAYSLLYSMRAEYQSKYRDLLKMHDSLIPPLEEKCGEKTGENHLYFIRPETLNFVDSALKWSLEKDPCMKNTFDRIVSRVDYIKMYFTKYYEILDFYYSTLSSHLKKSEDKMLFQRVNTHEKYSRLYEEWAKKVESSNVRREDDRLRELIKSQNYINEQIESRLKEVNLKAFTDDAKTGMKCIANYLKDLPDDNLKSS